MVTGVLQLCDLVQTASPVQLEIKLILAARTVAKKLHRQEEPRGLAPAEPPEPPRDLGSGARRAVPSLGCFDTPKLPPYSPASSSRAFVLVEEFPQPWTLLSEII